MIWFKSCPRCQVGDMTLDEDGDRLCLQCGYVPRAVVDHATTAVEANLLDMGKAGTRSPLRGTGRRQAVMAV